MSSANEEDVEYDSDPEEAKRSLSMRRRREASDDEEAEEEEEEEEDDEIGDKRVDHRRLIHSDESDDGEGGVADYDEEEEEEEEEEELVQEEEEYDEVVEEEEVVVLEEAEKGWEEGVGVNGAVVMVKDSDAGWNDDVPLEEVEKRDGEEEEEEEKKESEPFAVPTAGAFYMHDDRFRDNAGGRHRRMRGGRRLWESKDDKKWGHDKFEEITLHERHYKEGRRPSRGSYRGRGKTRGIGRGGYAQGNRKGYDDRENQTQAPKVVVRGRGPRRYEYDDRDNQTQAPKVVVRGRGPRRYEPAYKSTDSASQIQNKQSGKPPDKTSNVNSGRILKSVSNSESDPAPTKKQVFASNLNYASPPFYPSSSANKDTNQTPKRDIQTGSTSRNVHAGVMDEGFVVQQNNALLRGKNVVDAVSMDKLYIDGSIRPSVGKPLNNSHMQPPRSSEVNVSQSTYPRAAGKGVAVPAHYQPASSLKQLNKFAPTQFQAIQRTSGPGQASVHAPALHLGQRPGSASKASSPPETSVAITSLDSGEIDSASDSGTSKGTLVGKGRGGSQGSGRGSFVYGGTMGNAGNMGGSHGDQKFPTFLPVMQFGGQHRGGMGVPAVGMAFPGYVARPQMGMGSSEMTWLPVLAGAAGALGAPYCSPYLNADGAYHAQQSGQTSAVATSSKENNASNKADNESEPPQRPEPISDEFGQRHSKPRRMVYVEGGYAQAFFLQALCSLTVFLGYLGLRYVSRLLSYITPVHAVFHLKKLLQLDRW